MDFSMSPSPGRAPNGDPTPPRPDREDLPQPLAMPLDRAIAAISGAADPAQAGEALRAALATVFRGKSWVVGWDPDGEQACWLAGPAEGRPASLEARDGPLRAALREGRETIASPRGDPGTLRAFLPLMAGDRPAGCLVFEGKRDSFQGEAFKGIRSLLQVAALALRGTLLQQALHARVEERTAELTLLCDVSRSLGFVLSAEDLADLVASSLRRALPHDLCALTFLGSDGPVTRMRLWSGASPAARRRLQQLALQEARRLTGRRLLRGALEVAGPDDGAAGAPLAPSHLHAVVHASLVARGEVLGVLSVASREDRIRGEASMRLLRTVASQASLTLDRLRTAREEESRKIHSMLEAMAEGVLLLDGGLRVVLSNPAGQRYLERLASPAPRRLERLGDQDLSPLLDAGSARTFEVESEQDGRIHSVTCSPVHAVSSGVRGLVVVISDVTESRRMQVQLSQNERLSALGEMISGVAHELNNPLASVMVLAERLQDQPVDEDTRRKLSTIGSEASRCQRIVQNLLRFARPHAPEHCSVDVNAAIDAVLQLLGHQLASDNVKVRRHLDPSLPLVEGDRHLLQQVFLNLIHNAHQAMRDARGKGVLSLTTRREGDRVVAEVRDDGPGIPPPILPRIFDPFFSTKEVGKGTGLGLSLAYATVQQHGGMLTARSRPGEGAVFVVELPSGPDRAPASDPLSARPEPTRAGASLAGRKVLVVEDEAPLAEVMSEVLQSHGMAVEIAGDGRTARALLSQASFDVIISDLKMPRMSGRELYRQVAASSPELARRIIFSTGDTASPDTQAFFDEVGNPWLSKPFNLTELITAVERVLALS